MQIGNEHILDISLPYDHELAKRVPNTHKPQIGEEVFRTRAAIQLKEIFGKDLFTLRETSAPGLLSLRVAVKIGRLDEFRRRIADLGFSTAETNSDSSGR